MHLKSHTIIYALCLQHINSKKDLSLKINIVLKY